MSPVIAPGTSIVLDAKAAFALCTGHQLGEDLNAAYRLRTWHPKPIIPITVVGEILRLTVYLNYTGADRQGVEQAIRQLHIVNLMPDAALNFALMGAALDQSGDTKPAGKIWTAATCAAVRDGTGSAALLCCDGDYLAFQQFGLQVEFFDPTPYQDFPY